MALAIVVAGGRAVVRTMVVMIVDRWCGPMAAIGRSGSAGPGKAEVDGRSGDTAAPLLRERSDTDGNDDEDGPP